MLIGFRFSNPLGGGAENLRTVRIKSVVAMAVLLVVGLVMPPAQANIHTLSATLSMPSTEGIAPDKQGVSDPAHAPPSAPPGVNDAVAAVSELAKSAGLILNQVWYEPEINTVVAYLPPGPAPAVSGFKEKVNGLAASVKGFEVKVVEVARSMADSLALQAKIEADRSYLAGQGVTMVSDGITPDGETIKISILNGDLSSARELFASRYGEGIDVKQVTAMAGG